MVVRCIFDLYVSKRLGVRGVKRELEQRGIRTRKGASSWAPSVIEKILKDPVYKGRHASGIPAPVIIGDDQWNLAAERREANHYLKLGYEHRYALQGRAKCECGGRIRVEFPARGRGKAVYFCNNRYANSYHVMKGGERCRVPRRTVENTEIKLHQELIETMADPTKLIVLVERSIAQIEDELNHTSGDFGNTDAELAEVTKVMDDLEESWLRRRISPERRESLMVEFEAKRAMLEARLAKMSPESRATLEEKQRLLQGAMDYLRTLESRVELGLPSWKFSFMPSVAESEDLQMFRASEYNAVSRDPNGLPETLDNVLTEFNMSAVFRTDRVDLIGAIELQIQDETTHPHASTIGGS